jgi:hypothetical protein
MLPEMFSRRAALMGAGGSAGLLIGSGLTAAWRAHPAGYGETLRALASTLTPLQRRLMVFPADDPTRQIANTVAVLDRPHLGTLLSGAQLALVEQLYEYALSPRGRSALAGTAATEGRLTGCVLALYGEPERGVAQTVISGGHLLVRAGGAEDGGPVLGGAVAYGHQEGNGRWRVRGNSFAYHGDAANRLFGALTPDQRARAILSSPPNELLLQVQDERGRFPGLRLGDLSDAGQEAAEGLLDTVLGLYPAHREARAAIEAHGGLGRLHFACYRGFYADMKEWSGLDAGERARRGDPYWQVWRVEGPGTIMHFKGYPHVHAYVQVTRDPRRANIGEALAETAVAIEGEAMRRLVEGAFRRATGEALAFVPPDPPGRFCAGTITTGLAHTVDPFHETIVIAQIEGRAMTPAVRDRLGVAATGLHRVATTRYVAADEKLFGKAERLASTGVPVRDAVIGHLRAGALRSTAARPG